MMTSSVLFQTAGTIAMGATVASFQTTLDLAQGVWKEDVSEFESYVVVEGHKWYSITVLDGEVDVSLDWFGFYDQSDLDSLNPKNLADKGKYVVFLTYRKSIQNYDNAIDGNYFSFYDYDLASSNFIYYANDPVSMSRLSALPSKISEVFEKRKAELTHFNCIED